MERQQKAGLWRAGLEPAAELFGLLTALRLTLRPDEEPNDRWDAVYFAGVELLEIVHSLSEQEYDAWRRKWRRMRRRRRGGLCARVREAIHGW